MDSTGRFDNHVRNEHCPISLRYADVSRGTAGLDLPGVRDELDRGGVRGQTISEPNSTLWFTTSFLLSFFTLAFCFG